MAKLESMPPVWGRGLKRVYLFVFFNQKNRSIYYSTKIFEFMRAFLFFVIENSHTTIVSS